MKFARTEEQRLLADTLRRFLQSENDFELRRRRLGGELPDRMALWPGLAELGVIGAAFDEDQGGYAGDARTLAILMAELGRALVVEPLLGCAIVAGHVLWSLQDRSVANSSLDELIAGHAVTVLAHDAGADPFAEPSTSAAAGPDGFVLNGLVRCVRHADVAREFLVTARLDGKVALFRLARESLSFESYRLMDGSGAADLPLRNLAVGRETRLVLLRPEDVVLREALERGLFGLAAEAWGIIDAANAATFRYLNERHQFGAPLASFQALQHRAANMEIAALELGALLELSIESLSREPTPHQNALLSALKSVADAAGRLVGHEAIQLHGGMGVSDELVISHYSRRLATIRTQLGGASLHRQRFGADVVIGDLLAQQDSPEAREWRQTVRAFTRAHLPERIARKSRLGLKIDKDDYVGWQKVLHEHGLFGDAWPREYGGADWDLVKQLIFAQESSVCDAPLISPYGVNMVGPVVYTFGTDEQKRRHLPGILTSDVWWCQGYSEPGAGSDLANLKTTAERDGDHYVVNGAKLWTTEAHWADWMHCLVRTDKAGKPQAGITFLLIDMRTPGITIKPILTIDGLHHTNALFLDDVRVPVGNRVGEEGRGWEIAKFLLSRERVFLANTGPKLRLLERMHELHRSTEARGDMPAALRALLRDKYADVSIQLLTLCALERQCVEAWSAGASLGAEASVLKVRGSEVLQALCELALELEGVMAAAHDPADAHRSPYEPLSPAQTASLMAYEYLYSRCWSIFGGTNEIQRNIIAKQVLSR
jgi:alkylation response protein AidB-like acyl-CoA dehydrogenase